MNFVSQNDGVLYVCTTKRKFMIKKGIMEIECIQRKTEDHFPSLVDLSSE